MSKIKKVMLKGMNAVMLDCDKATFLATKNDIERLSCIPRLQLKLHLMGCKLCRSFAEQAKYITKEIDIIRKVDPDNLEMQLTSEQKEKIQHTVEINIDK